jgi:hypothetical protein
MMGTFPVMLRAETLHSLVVQSAKPPDANSLPNLHRDIAGYAVLDSGDWFVAAYYLEGASPGLEAPLFVDRYDRKAGQWRSAAFSREQLRDSEGDCLGSVLRLEVSADSFLLSTHLNPSAQCLFVLSTGLDVRTTLYGWPLATFRDGSVVFHRSQIHFSPVHSAEIGFYNRQTGRSYTLYPSKPFQAVRLAEIAKLREFFEANEDWCNRNNHPCDPERPGSWLGGDVVTTEQSDAIAFIINYGGEFQDARTPPVSAGQREVVCVFRWVHNEYAFQYREMLKEEMTTGFGEISLHELVIPPRMKQLFGN